MHVHAIMYFLFLLQSGGFSPVGGTTFFPQNQPAYTSVSSNPPSPTDNNNTAEESVGQEEEKETPSSLPSSPPSTPSEKKDSSTSDQLEEGVKQLSLDSAYTSEADLEQSTSSSVSPQEGPSTPQEGPASEAECSGDDEKEPPVDINRIVERRSPRIVRSSHVHVQARVPPKYTSIYSASPPGHHYNSGPVYFGSASGYVPAGPYTYSPYTPPAAIQTIGPVFHGNQ